MKCCIVPKTYTILSEAVELGLSRGYKRAFKHTDNPDEDSILQCQLDAIMLEISDRFKFEELEDNCE